MTTSSGSRASPAAPVASSRGPLYVVINAGSGRQEADEARRLIGAVFERAGREHEFLPIGNPETLPMVADRAVALALRNGGVVVAAGGDGTVNGVAQQVLGRGCPFGVLPQGTFNYFARTHGIPQEAEAAAQALLRAQVAPVQAGRVNGRVFLVNASLGLYPQLLEDREAFKAQLGRSRMVALMSGLWTLLREHRQLYLDLEVEGRRQQIRTPTLFVGNNPLQLRQIGIEPAEAVEHGQLVGLALKPVDNLHMLGLVLRGALGRLGEAEQIMTRAFAELRVEARRRGPIRAAVDGEILFLQPPLSFTVADEPLWLMQPVAEDRAEVA